MLKLADLYGYDDKTDFKKKFLEGKIDSSVSVDQIDNTNEDVQEQHIQYTFESESYGSHSDQEQIKLINSNKNKVKE